MNRSLLNNQTKHFTFQQRLIVLLSFFLPLENALDFFFGIDTILKPYRVIEIILIINYFVKVKRHVSVTNLMYFVLPLAVMLIGGALATLINYTGVQINYALVFNWLLLFGLNLFVFVIILSENFGNRLLISIFVSFLFGLFLNSIPVFFGPIPIDNRFSGFFVNSNSFGLCSVLGAIMTLYSLREKIIGNILALLAVAVLFYFINSTHSRTSLILFGVVLLLLFSRQKVNFAIIVVLIGGLFYAAGGGVDFKNLNAVKRQALKEGSEQENERLIFAKAGYDAFYNTNFIGLGIGQFQEIENFFLYVKMHSLAIANDRKSEGSGLGTHNSYIQIMSEFGLIGVFGFILFILRVFFYLKKGKSFFYFIFSYEFAFLVTIVLYSIFHVVFFSPLFWFIVAVCLKMKYTFRNVHIHSYRKVWRNKPSYNASQLIP